MEVPTQFWHLRFIFKTRPGSYRYRLFEDMNVNGGLIIGGRGFEDCAGSEMTFTFVCGSQNASSSEWKISQLVTFLPQGASL